MPKKKKAVKGKKATKKAPKKEHPLSDMERFVAFQIATRTDAIKAMQAQRDELLRDNVVSLERLAAARQRRTALLGDVRAVTENTESRVRGEANGMHDQLEQAVAGKAAFVREQEALLLAQRESLAATEAALAEAQTWLDTLRAHANGGSGAMATQAALLTQQLADMAADFDRECATLAAHNARAHQRLGELKMAEIAATKADASAAAISALAPPARAVFADNNWLKREIAEHEAERDRVAARCEALEQSALDALRVLHAHHHPQPGGGGRWTSLAAYKAAAAEDYGGSGDGDESDESDEEGSDQDDDDSDDDDDELENENATRGAVSSAFARAASGLGHRRPLQQPPRLLSAAATKRADSADSATGSVDEALDPRARARRLSDASRLALFPQLALAGRLPDIGSHARRPAPRSSVGQLPPMQMQALRTQPIN